MSILAEAWLSSDGGLILHEIEDRALGRTTLLLDEFPYLAFSGHGPADRFGTFHGINKCTFPAS
jgi:hypothetical protein